MLPVYTLAREAFPASFPPAPGAAADVTLVFSDGHTGAAVDAAWGAVSARPPVAWADFVAPRADGAVVMVRALAVGGRGRCTNRRHCTEDLHAAEVAAFRAHVLAHYGVVPTVPAVPTAVVVARAGRRRLANTGDVVAALRRGGWDDTRVVGPFAGVPLADQLRAVANASLAVMMYGAELAVAWLALPPGACASVVFPLGFADALPWWVGDKVGVRIAPFYEPAVTRDDPRLARPLTSMDDGAALMHGDVTIPVWLWRPSVWCADDGAGGFRPAAAGAAAGGGDVGGGVAGGEAVVDGVGD
jgi:hypothetical protein